MKIFAVITKSAAAAAVCLLTGCMSFEYAGRTFSPDESSNAVQYFESRSKMPAGKYSIIGRGTLITASDTDREDIIIRLQDEAADRGADAVCIVSAGTKRIGIFENDDDHSNPDNGKNVPYNLTPDGASDRKKLTGTPTTLPSEYFTSVRLVIKVLFFKDKDQLEKAVSIQKDQLDKIVNHPAALPGTNKAAK